MAVSEYSVYFIADTLADLPVNPAYEGYQAYTKYTRQLWIADALGQWQVVPSGAAERFVSIRMTSIGAALDDTDDMILVDASGAAVQVTLPSATGRRGRTFTIIKTDETANHVVIAAPGGQLISLAANYIITIPTTSISVTSDDQNWWIN